MALERGLGRYDLPVRRHNIWEDPDAAQFVRSHAGGNETVPTVAIGGTVLVNPRPREVLEVMAVETPQLMPDDIEMPEGLLSRIMGRRRRG
ncbi:MAG TPA: NrdH-redoxin [Acidimicrobiales bacterium]|nr:NrdH-redoxin [Acidimicrobiales bacterium]